MVDSDPDNPTPPDPDPAPKGEQGQTGSQGPDGQTGPQGPPKDQSALLAAVGELAAAAEMFGGITKQIEASLGGISPFLGAIERLSAAAEIFSSVSKQAEAALGGATPESTKETTTHATVSEDLKDSLNSGSNDSPIGGSIQSDSLEETIALAISQSGATFNEISNKLEDSLGGNPGDGPSTPTGAGPTLDFDKLLDSLRSGVQDPFVTTLENAFDPVLQLSRGLTESLSQMAMSNKQLKAAQDEARKSLLDQIEASGEDVEEYKESVTGQNQLQAVHQAATEKFTKEHNSKFLKKFGALITVPIANFSRYISGIISNAIQLQDTALKFNKTFTEAVSQAGNKIAKVPGNLASKMDSLFAFEAEGLQQVGKHTLGLAGRMKATGQDVQGLVSLNKRLLTLGNMSLAETDAFMQTLHNTSVKYQVSTDLLIKGLDHLAQSLGVLALGGTTEQVGTATTELGAQFPGLADEITKFADKLATTEISQAGLLNVFDDLNKITSGQVSTAAEMRAIIANVARGAKRFTGDFKNMQIGTKRQMQEIIGDIGFMGITLDSKLNNFVEKQISSSDKIFKSLKVAMGQILEPLETTITSIITKLGSLGEVVSKIDEGLKTFTNDLFGVSTVLKALLVNAIFSKVGRMAGLGTKLAPFKATNAIKWGGLITTLKKWWSGLRILTAFKGLFFAVSRFFAPLAIITGVIWGISKLLGDNEKNTAELAKIERSKQTASLGKSRFERITSKILSDQMLSGALRDNLVVTLLTEQLDQLKANGVPLVPVVPALPIIR